MQSRSFANGLKIFSPHIHQDERGYFYEFSKSTSLAEHGIVQPLEQTNISLSKQGVLRGMHYQKPPYAQAKLVSCLAGAIWDVVIDIRKDSATYLQWFSFYLTAKSFRQLWIPEGFLHGFYTLSAQATVLYQTTHEYRPNYDFSVAYYSPCWQIPWPKNPCLSIKDREAKVFDADVDFFDSE